MVRLAGNGSGAASRARAAHRGFPPVCPPFIVGSAADAAAGPWDPPASMAVSASGPIQFADYLTGFFDEPPG